MFFVPIRTYSLGKKGRVCNFNVSNVSIGSFITIETIVDEKRKLQRLIGDLREKFRAHGTEK